MAPIFVLSSALEVFLVLVASAMFMGMIIAAVAAVVWFVAGLFSATRETPTAAR